MSTLAIVPCQRPSLNLVSRAVHSCVYIAPPVYEACNAIGACLEGRMMVNVVIHETSGGQPAPDKWRVVGLCELYKLRAASPCTIIVRACSAVHACGRVLRHHLPVAQLVAQLRLVPSFTIRGMAGLLLLKGLLVVVVLALSARAQVRHVARCVSIPRRGHVDELLRALRRPLGGETLSPPFLRTMVDHSSCAARRSSMWTTGCLCLQLQATPVRCGNGCSRSCELSVNSCDMPHDVLTSIGIQHAAT
jgi:hypothetical protein